MNLMVEKVAEDPILYTTAADGARIQRRSQELWWFGRIMWEQAVIEIAAQFYIM